MNSGLLCATAHCGARRSVTAAIKAERHQRSLGIFLSIADAESLAGRMLERKGDCGCAFSLRALQAHCAVVPAVAPGPILRSLSGGHGVWVPAFAGTTSGNLTVF